MMFSGMAVFMAAPFLVVPVLAALIVVGLVPMAGLAVAAPLHPWRRARVTQGR